MTTWEGGRELLKGDSEADERADERTDERALPGSDRMDAFAWNLEELPRTLDSSSVLL